MLNLASQSSPAWLARSLADLDEILLDHAHCEKKAASTALSLIFRYPERSALLEPLSQLAREELQHFELMLGHLERRGIVYRKQKPSPYAGQLMAIVRTAEPERLLDTLLCCALIEARSCERMQILAENLEDPELARLYRSLLASEARHHNSYVGLAETYFARDQVRVRLAEIAAHEAEVIATAPPLPRMHC
ncbi:MAG: tRNA-(ms[2]io[6]A)-hydroxylase [Planctomycetes bacterium]|nr:tRNA-(ms[2]io[6]A)-hydroxylase [Planctomycetota bacterium]